PLAEPLEGREPGHPLPARPLPERVRVLVVDLRLCVRGGGEVCGRGIGTGLDEQRGDVVGHAVASFAATSGVPTGRESPPPIPLVTPAAEAYQATSAVSTPMYPPSFTVPVMEEKLPMNRMISVISRVRNTPKTALLIFVLHSSMYVLKIAKASRIQPRSLPIWAGVAVCGRVRMYR